MKNPRASIGKPALAIAALMPHAPILVPSIASQHAANGMETASAMREVASRIVSAKPSSLILLSPHAPWHSGAFGIYEHAVGSLEEFGAPDIHVDLPLDRTLAREIPLACEDSGIKTWKIEDPLDHGAVVPLTFLTAAGWAGLTVVVGLSPCRRTTIESLGGALAHAAAAIEGPVALVVSGDMSHRLTPSSPCGHHPRAHEFDDEFIRVLKSGQDHLLLGIDAGLRELAGEDAFDPVLAAIAACDSTEGREVLSYAAPFGVGYGVAILFQKL